MFLARTAIQAAEKSPHVLGGSRPNSLNGVDSVSEEDGMSLIEVVQNGTGMSLFAAYLVREYCHESILFLMEVFQFRKQFKNVPAIRENINPEFRLSDIVPICRTIKNNPNDYYKQAEVIRDRFVPYASPLCINLSHQMRKELEVLDFRRLKEEELAVAFDEAYRKIFSLLRDPYFRFRQTYEYEELVKQTKSSIPQQLSGHHLQISISGNEHKRISSGRLDKISQDMSDNLFAHKDYMEKDKVHQAFRKLGDFFAGCCCKEK